jgi:hypothetical protein
MDLVQALRDRFGHIDCGVYAKIVQGGIAAVDRGRVSVSAGSDVAKLPKEKQREVVACGEEEILDAAKQIRTA